MPTLTVDLNDADDLVHAQAVIAERIKTLGAQDEAAGTDAQDEISPERAVEIAQRLSQRIQTPETADLVRCFASFGRPFSLQEVADELPVDYATVKARKFRFGRTEKKLLEEFGTRLLKSTWQGDRNLYTIDPNVRGALLEALDASG